MKKIIGGLLYLLMGSLAGAQTVQWSSTFFLNGNAIVPTGGVALSGGLLTDAFVIGSGGAVIQMGPRSSGVFGPVSGFVPIAPCVMPNDDWRLVGKQHGGNGIKTQYFGSGTSNGFSGALDYTYTANGTSNDEPLCIGVPPFGSYVCANIQGTGTRQLIVLQAASSGPNPVVLLTDATIAPRQASINSSLITVAGDDNNAPTTAGGARASAYTINTNGTVSSAFTKTFANTLVNHVFTSHELLWGGQSNAFNVLVDNQTIHDGVNNTFDYSFVLHAYDGAGNELWTSSRRAGTIFRLGAGSIYNTWVLGTNGPGQFLISYGLDGVLRRATSTKATRLVVINNAGAVVAGNEIDNTGHHHIQVTRYGVNGKEMWNTSYASAATDDDTVSDIIWDTGVIYAAGGVVTSAGKKGLWGASWQ